MTVRRGDLPPFGSEREGWFERACEHIDETYLFEILERMVETPSPTGAERALGELLAADMAKHRVNAAFQPIGDDRGNAVGRVDGAGGGPVLLLYGQLDTTFVNDRREDMPVLGDADRPDLEPELTRRGDLLCGLGVSNPKGGNACALAAVDAIVRAGVPLAGDVIVGFVSGGVHKRPIEGLARSYQGAAYEGFGIGCHHMLDNGVAPDCAISTKPGYGIVWEEPGECRFMIEVKGILSYTGMRHIQRHRNPIIDAARLAQAIEEWIPAYTKRHTAGQLAPQGAVGAIEGGWPYKPEFIPGVCRIYVNLHSHADTPPAETEAEFGDFIAAFRAANPGIEFDWHMTHALAGAATDPASWIVQSCWRALEDVEDTPHAPTTTLSGTTDGNILRSRGIPTVRLGPPGLVSLDDTYPPFFEACRAGDLPRLARVYIRAIIDTCTRTQDEIAHFQPASTPS